MFLIDATGSMRHTIKAAHDKAREIAEEFSYMYNDIDFRFGSVWYRDPIHLPNHNRNEFQPLNPDINVLINFLSTIKATGGGGDGGEDIAGGFDIALNQIQWRDGPKNIILIADDSAHGKRFCGKINHEDQTERLVSLIKQVANRGIFVSCIAIGSVPINCFKEMEKIYFENNGPSFTISPFEKARSGLIPIENQIGKKLEDESCRIHIDSYQHY